MRDESSQHADRPPSQPGDRRCEIDGGGHSRAANVSRRGFLKGVAAGAAVALPADGLLGRAMVEEGALPGAAGVLGPEAVAVTLHVNGKKLETKVEPRVTLLDALRDHTQIGSVTHLDLTGTKRVCDRASCGACTVLLDGRPVYACTVLAITAQAAQIRTIEGLADGDRLDPVQEAFIHCDGLMCGFCTPGFIMSARALLDENPRAGKDDILRGLDGNICRCGTQTRVVEAVLLAASKKKDG